MRCDRRLLLGWLLALVPLAFSCSAGPVGGGPRPGRRSVRLPAPEADSGPPLTQVLARRRSVRAYRPRPLTEREIGQLLWATQGITDPVGLRTAPSAGATYPLEVYVATAAGLYGYQPDGHSLVEVLNRDVRGDLADAGLGQSWLRQGPAVFIIAAVYPRTATRYGSRAERYVHLEAGHACQNLLLQAEALGLGGVAVGAFDDAEVARVLGMPADQSPLYLVPVGQPA
jgi:SagB-type dehydrogenase family enzyme